MTYDVRNMYPMQSKSGKVSENVSKWCIDSCKRLMITVYEIIRILCMPFCYLCRPLDHESQYGIGGV